MAFIAVGWLDQRTIVLLAIYVRTDVLHSRSLSASFFEYITSTHGTYGRWNLDRQLAVTT
jgi:hypothetical protein